MKRTKHQEPSVAGLILIVAGLLLLSILALSLTGNGAFTGDNSKVTLAMASAAVVSLSAGAALSGRKKR